MATDDDDLRHLRRCVELASAALEAGDEPFGSMLVAADGTVLFEDHNHVASGDQTRHPEFELARWAAANLDPAERAAATVYTSGEHCPMCAAAHGWVGLGRIVYVSSSEQLAAWLAELGVPPPPVRTLPIREVVPGVPVELQSPTWPRRSTTCTAASTRTARPGIARGPGLRRTDLGEIEMDLADFKVLSFDCYGTLIDWETGIAAVLGPWAREAGLDLADERLLAAYADHEAAVERDHPTARYPDVLATAFRRTGEALGRPVDGAWARRLGDSGARLAGLPRLGPSAPWPPGRPLPADHRPTSTATGSPPATGGCVAATAVITAEDVGAYKPAGNHFEALFRTLDDYGVARGKAPPVAQSLFHDHVPAHRAGIHQSGSTRRRPPRLGRHPQPSETWTYDLEFSSAPSPPRFSPPFGRLLAADTVALRATPLKGADGQADHQGDRRGGDLLVQVGGGEEGDQRGGGVARVMIR